MGHTPGLYGVGFIINKVHKNNIESFTGITERIAVLNMNIQGFLISTCIKVYAPTESASEEEIEKFYETIAKALDTAHNNVILMGDFNAKIGLPQKEEHLVIKQFGCGKRNGRGQRLVDFAVEHKLTLINTCFKKKLNRRWTWRSPDGKIKNEIDYILSNQPKIFQDFGTMNLNYPSDHRLIRAKVKLTNLKKSRVNYSIKHTNQLKSEVEIAKYRKTLSGMVSRQCDGHEHTSVQTHYDNISNVITTSLKSENEKGTKTTQDTIGTHIVSFKKKKGTSKS